MRIVVRRALEKQQLLRQINNLETRLLDKLSFDRIIGKSPAMQEVYEVVEKVVTNDVTVLITGESGHRQGARRASNPLSLPPQIKAIRQRQLRCNPGNSSRKRTFRTREGVLHWRDRDQNWTIRSRRRRKHLLDEIGDMPLSLQSKMLRVLQEREISRVGGNKSIKVDIRVIAATNQNLSVCVEKKIFREDLFFRLNVLPIRLPPLRHRQDDITMLVNYFITSYNPRLNKSIRGVSPDAMFIMSQYPLARQRARA